MHALRKAKHAFHLVAQTGLFTIGHSALLESQGPGGQHLGPPGRAALGARVEQDIDVQQRGGLADLHTLHR